MELSPSAPASLAQVIMRALEKEPDMRQSSAAQLSDELKQAVTMDEGSLLSLAEPLLTRPLKPPDARTSHKAIPSVEEPGNQPPSLAEARPSPFDRNTTELSRPSVESDATPTKGEVGRPTSPNEKAAPVREMTDLVRETNDLSPGGKARIRSIALAAVALVLLAAAVIYFSMKDERTAQTVSESPNPKSPEGMAYIPGGKFVMGRNDGSPDEGPAHEVEIKPFFLDVQEVTNQEYRKFVDATGRPAPKHWKLNGSYSPDGAGLPVTYVSWEDAASYAKWANKRLPTEAEWEYAARGGGKAYLYPWGNQWQPGYANVDSKGQTKPSPVRSFEKDLSLFGIYDLAGNVSEWVQDFYSDRYGARPDQQFRVYRGGNFLDGPERGTNTYRWYDFPVLTRDVDAFRVGFRCAKDIGQ
ncbi:MAG: SUMF1/EgtB/PvdO family nonheme iron enzyme [Blastocatellia bacterium]